MPVSISGSGPITGLTSIASPTTLNGLTIPTTGFGKVLQVVFASTSGEIDNSTTTYADTGLTGTITPSSTSSKILVLANHTVSVRRVGIGELWIRMKVVRSSTDIYTNTFGFGIYTSVSGGGYNYGQYPIMLLDSPASTSALTYKTQFASSEAGQIVRVQSSSNISTLLLVEVGP